ncbi:MAG: hypothetical protein AABY13_04490, partial [Nanoarchaeota archaeon]
MVFGFLKKAFAYVGIGSARSDTKKDVRAPSAPTIDDAAWNAMKEASRQEEVRVITPPRAQPAVGSKTRLRSIERHVEPDGTEVQVVRGYDGSERRITRRLAKNDTVAGLDNQQTTPVSIPDDMHPLGADWNTVYAYPSYAGFDKQVIRKHYATHMAWNAIRDAYANSYLPNFVDIRKEGKHLDAPKDFETFLLDHIARELRYEKTGDIGTKVLCRYAEKDDGGRVAKEHVAFVTEFGTFHKEYLENLLKREKSKTRLRYLAEGHDMPTAALTRIDLSA